MSEKQRECEQGPRGWVLIIFLIIFPIMAAPLWAQTRGTGVVTGRLVNGTTATSAGAGLEIDVIGLAGGMSVLKSSATDESGRFEIDGLPTDGPILIRANYGMVNYHGRVAFDANGKATVEVKVYETTTETRGLRLENVRFGFQLEGDHLRELERYSFVNETRPKMSYMNMDGNFRFSKPDGLHEIPGLSVTGPGSTMPLVQSPLESPDGKSYYSRYGLRPGTTTFDVDMVIPYHDRAYEYRKTFYHDVESYQIGVIPKDLIVSGEGLERIEVNEEQNFAIYSSGPIAAGSEIVWNFEGGTPLPASSNTGSGGSSIRPMATAVGQRTLLLGPLVLLCFIVVLWFAYSRVLPVVGSKQDPYLRQLKKRRDRLVTLAATLDHRHDRHLLERPEYTQLRERAKGQLRRISHLVAKRNREARDR